MDFPKIIASMRLKNEERWIQKALNAASQVCTGIVVLDDGSTDRTLDICKNHSNVVDIKHQENLPVNITRDLTTIWQMARKQKPDFIMHLDGDEILQSNAKQILYEDIELLYPDYVVYDFQGFYIWDNPKQYRYDGLYSNVWVPKLLRISDQPENFVFTQNESNLNSHPSIIPINTKNRQKAARSRLKLFHYGNFDQVLRQTKFNLYNKLYPNDTVFDNYTHIISGKGKFSGTNGIELKFLPDSVFIDIESK